MCRSARPFEVRLRGPVNDRTVGHKAGLRRDCRCYNIHHRSVASYNVCRTQYAVPAPVVAVCLLRRPSRRDEGKEKTARLDGHDFRAARDLVRAGRPAGTYAGTAHVVGKTVVFLLVAVSSVGSDSPFGASAHADAASSLSYRRRGLTGSRSIIPAPVPSPLSIHRRLRCPHPRLQAEASLKIHRLITHEQHCKIPSPHHR